MAAIVSKVSSVPAVVRVGVACFITCDAFPQAVLLGQRMGSHGAGKWALPGGHLELNESWETCAAREVKEETNLTLDAIRFVGVTNDPCIDGNEAKHYITLFMAAKVSSDSEPLQNMEPHKCKEWIWTPIQTLVEMHRNTPECLFDPMLHYFAQHDGSEIEGAKEA